MGKGGGFSGGGGFKGGGFSGGGGFKGSGFGGSFKGGGSKPNVPHNHSYRPHNTGGNFWTGLFIGSMLNNSRRRTTYVSNNYAPGGQNAQGQGSQNAEQMQQYLKCNYCNAEFIDTTLQKCPNCGAPLDHRMRKIGTSGDTTNSSAARNAAYDEALKRQQQRHARNTVVAAIVIVAVFAIMLVVLFSVLNNASPTNPWEDGVKEFKQNSLVNTEYLTFRVISVVRQDLPEHFQAASGMVYFFVTVEISNNIYGDELPIYVDDFSIMSEENTFRVLQNAPVGHGYAVFPIGSGNSAYFTIATGANQTIVFVYLVPVSYALDELAFVYNEYNEYGTLLGFYAMYLS